MKDEALNDAMAPRAETGVCAGLCGASIVSPQLTSSASTQLLPAHGLRTELPAVLVSKGFGVTMPDSVSIVTVGVRPNQTCPIKVLVITVGHCVGVPAL